MNKTAALTPLKLLTLCYPVIPSGGGEQGKAPLVNWLEYQTSFPTEYDLERWERELHPSLWGIVTGGMSGIVIIDIDNPSQKTIFDEANLLPHIQTPRGGFHYWFRHPGPEHHIKTVAGLLPGVDTRGDGGFVNVIGKRKDGEYVTLITPTPDAIHPWESLPSIIKKALTSNKQKSEETPPEGQTIIPEGQRNSTLTSLAGTMRRRGLPESAILAALLEVNHLCQPPLPDNDVKDIAKSISRYPPTDNNKRVNIYIPSEADLATERYKSVTENVTKEKLASQIEEWVRDTSGWFSYEDIDKEFSVTGALQKGNRRVIVKRLKDAGIIEANPKNNKLLRHVNVSTRIIDFRAAGKRTSLTIKYPFGIERYFNTFPGNVIALAGAADSGKTGFLLNFIRMNQYNFAINYLSSEMGKEELASRLEKFDGISIDEWNFTAEERSRDFADVIRPDCINLIDYLEFEGDFFNITTYLRQIHDRLAGGIAIVALQKKRNAELGRGGDFGLEKPRLYLTMDKGKVTILKCKNWANPEENPNGLTLNFKIVAGCKFIVTNDWHTEDE